MFEDPQALVLIRRVLGAHPEREAGWNHQANLFPWETSRPECASAEEAELSPVTAAFLSAVLPGVPRGRGGMQRRKTAPPSSQAWLHSFWRWCDVLLANWCSPLCVAPLCVYVWRGWRAKMGWRAKSLSLLAVLLLKQLGGGSQAAASWLAESVSSLGMTGGKSVFWAGACRPSGKCYCSEAKIQKHWSKELAIKKKNESHKQNENYWIKCEE